MKSYSSSGEKITALYERLSRDDEQQGDSNSIINQKQYLMDFCSQQGFQNIRHFTDDGYSGTNFERPGFQELLGEINAGHVETVIVKDMSRFGRNYLQVGYYTDILFPERHIRFIAVNNNIDSDRPGSNDFTPFLNIMNEWYAKDTSRKIQTIFHARMQKGLRCSGAVPFGYTRNPGDKQTLVVAPDEAVIVKKIFRMAADGLSLTEIARKLMDERILNATAFRQKYHPENVHSIRYKDPYYWSATGVSHILKRKEYLGYTVLGKTKSVDFKRKKKRNIPGEEQLVFPNTHEPIIDPETWQQAQRIMNRSAKKTVLGITSRLSGLVYCADCGERMRYSSYRAKEAPEADSSYSFQCAGFAAHPRRCANHYIRESTIEKAVAQAMRTVMRHAFSDEGQFIADLQKKFAERTGDKHIEERKELKDIENRLLELGRLSRGLYEKNMSGVLSDMMFENMMKEYDAEMRQKEGRKAELESSIRQAEAETSDPQRFIDLLKKYRECSYVTNQMLYALIDRIEVHAAENGDNGQRSQRIDVYFSFLPETPASITGGSTSEETDEDKRKHDAEIDKRLRQKRREDLIAAVGSEEEADAMVEEVKRRRLEHDHEYQERIKKRMEEDEVFAEEMNRKKKERNRRGYQKKKEKWKELVARAETDSEAAKEIEKIRQRNRGRHQKRKPRVRTPEQREKENAQQKIRYKIQRQKMKEGDQELIDKYQVQMKQQAQRKKDRINELKEKAPTDPRAAEELAKFRASQKATNERMKAKIEARVAVDPDYAEYIRQRNQDYNRRHSAKRSEKLRDLIERAETDPGAAKELSELRAKNREKTRRRRERLKAEKAAAKAG